MSSERRFFLGIGGEQTGPFSEDEVRSKILSEEATAETLVWYEGLSEWQRLDHVAFFQPYLTAPKAPQSETPLESPAGDSPRSTGGERPPIARLEPVFSASEAVFFRPKGPRPQVLAIGAALLLLGLGLFWYLDDGDSDGFVVPAPQTKAGTSRASRLTKADSEYLLNPLAIPEDLMRLVDEDSKDEVGLKAVAALESIYKKRAKAPELGKLYMKIGRFSEAATTFENAKLYKDAVQAALEGYKNASVRTEKRALLTKAIRLLTGPAEDIPGAISHITTLEKEFPHEPNPFSYYLLSEERKIADLFHRTSYFFVENIINHIKSEFPQVRLETRPIVSVARQNKGFYRIVGKYNGTVLLHLDKLKEIQFEYWMSSGEWNLVGTNITSERQAWAKMNRAKLQSQAQSGKALLVYLEGVMRAQFPQVGLHEKVSQEDMSSAARETATAK